MLYRARVWPIFQGHWQQREQTWQYTQASSLEQAGHNLRQRFPPPNWHVEPAILDRRQIHEAAQRISKQIVDRREK